MYSATAATGDIPMYICKECTLTVDTPGGIDAEEDSDKYFSIGHEKINFKKMKNKIKSIKPLHGKRDKTAS